MTRTKWIEYPGTILVRYGEHPKSVEITASIHPSQYQAAGVQRDSFLVNRVRATHCQQQNFKNYRLVDETILE
jgi:hypothetical protein